MTYDQFKTLVKEMREAQKAYFKTRAKSALNWSMRLEKQVDQAVENVERKPDPEQKSLF